MHFGSPLWGGELSPEVTEGEPHSKSRFAADHTAFPGYSNCSESSSHSASRSSLSLLTAVSCSLSLLRPS
ncbi:hypothetical protein Bbre01_01267 [Bifidobacterium breve]